MPKTGEINKVAGIYRSECVGKECKTVERTMPENHKFPPCPHCNHACNWTLVRKTQTN